MLISPKAVVSMIAFAKTAGELGGSFLGQVTCLLSSHRAVGSRRLGRYRRSTPKRTHPPQATEVCCSREADGRWSSALGSLPSSDSFCQASVPDGSLSDGTAGRSGLVQPQRVRALKSATGLRDCGNASSPAQRVFPDRSLAGAFNRRNR
jgi:hypothetical protein